MLRQLSTCVSDESCAMKCAFDFDYDDEEFYVIDDDEDDEGDDDEYCINNDGAYWKTPGIHPLVCTTFFEPQEPEEFPPWDNYDHETLTTRFSRQTSATLESILGGSSSLLSPSANYIIEDLHLLEQRSHKSADDDKKRSTLAKVRDNRAPFNSPMVSQKKPSHHHRHHRRAAQAVTTDSGRYAPPPLQQNLNSPTSPTSTNHQTATTSEAIANPRAAKSPTALLRRRWSNLSPTFFGSKTPSPRSPQPSLPPIVESGGDDAKSKNTHPSTSTATSSGFLLHHEDDDDDEEEEEHSPYHHRNRALELTLSGSILELTLSESIQEEQSEIIRLDSIISHQSSLFFSINEDDMVVLEKISKRKRMWNKFRFRVAAWKRIAMFHLFPHRRAYTRFEI